MKSNTEQLALAEKHLGEGGSKFRKFCGMSSGPYCNAFVCYVFNEAGNASLFYGGKKVTYCPNSIKWCQNNLAQIPIYLALPSDVIYFDWEPNGTPNHIGFVRERKSDLEIYTIEGNTSKTNSSGRVVATGVVAYKTRQLYGTKNGKRVQYIQAVFRPHFKPTGFSASKKLVVDSYFGYNSIAVMQRWLGVPQDAILGVGTIKALQKRLGVAQDGSWGPKTSKALQRLIGTDADGEFGPASVRAFQTYLNKAVFGSTSTPSIVDKELSACKAQADCMKNSTYKWESNPTIEKSKKKGTCVTYVACVLQRIGVLKSGQYVWHNESGKVYGNNDKMTVTYPKGKTLHQLKGELKAGDIVMDGNKSDSGSGSHIFILTGKWNGSNPIIWDNHSGQQGKGAYTYSRNRSVIAIVRLK